MIREALDGILSGLLYEWFCPEDIRGYGFEWWHEEIRMSPLRICYCSSSWAYHAAEVEGKDAESMALLLPKRYHVKVDILFVFTFVKYVIWLSTSEWCIFVLYRIICHNCNNNPHLCGGTEMQTKVAELALSTTY